MLTFLQKDIVNFIINRITLLKKTNFLKRKKKTVKKNKIDIFIYKMSYFICKTEFSIFDQDLAK